MIKISDYLQYKNIIEKQMNKKRMSERKSELRLNLQDFCLSLPENSDPIVGYLLTILQWEASLDIETNSVLHKSFVNQIEQLKCKLKLQLKSIKNRDEIKSHNNSISKYINEFHKLKQVFSYCLILSKKKSELCQELEKYCQYKPTEINLTEELQNYLNEPIIFQTIFHSYLRAFNVNILTADLISFLYAEHQQKKHSFHDQNSMSAEQQKKGRRRWSNSDIELLKNKTINFKELTNMNKKYLKLQKSLQNSYIHYLCHDFFDSGQSSNAGNNNNNPDNRQSIQNENRVKTEQQNILKEKVKRLERILIKIKNQPGLNIRQTKTSLDTQRPNPQKSVAILLQVEPLCNLSALEMANDENQTASKVIQANKQFFLSTLYGKSWCQVLIGDQQFTFMRDKIIKVEALFFLNRILAATNAIAYAYNQLDLEVRDNHQFQFKNLRKLIGSEFINRETYQTKQCSMAQKTVFYSSESGTKAYSITDCFNNKILYPSAINYFICFIRSMISINFNGTAESKQETSQVQNGKHDSVITEEAQANNDEGILQILQAKSEYMESLFQTIINIYEIIRVKQLSCYKILREFSQIILKSSCWNHLSRYSSLDALIGAVSMQKQKIGIISQIVYQFDHNYSIKDPLLQLIRIEFDGLTNNCLNTFDLYKSVLCEIIQIRNGLKLDHFYSVNQIHQNFSLIPSDIEKLDAKRSKHQDIYFEDIIHEICMASQTNLYLPKLFFFFDLQLKFKRIVFKLQLCWSSGNGSVSGHSSYHDASTVMFDKKSQAFKQFLNTFCAPIFEIVHQCRSIVQILEKMQEIERYTQIFSEQVSRYHLIEKLVSIIGGYGDCMKIPSLREHIIKLTKQDLVELHTALNIFNPIESQKCSNRLSLMQALCKNVCTYNTIRVTELSLYNPAETKLREELASILFLLAMITVRNEDSHHQQIVHLYHQDKILTNKPNKSNFDLSTLLNISTNVCIDSKKMIKIRGFGHDLYLMKEIDKMNERYQLWARAQNQEDLIKLNEQLLVLSIIQTLREMEERGEGSEASQDHKNLTKLMNKFEISKIFSSLSSIEEIQFWRKQLSIMTKYHQIYQLMFHFDQFNSKVYGKASKKVQYKERKLLNQTDHKVDFNNQRCDFITKIHYVFQVSQLTRQKLQKNIQKLQVELLQMESAYSKPAYYRTKLKGKLYTAFCQQIQQIVTKFNLKAEINIKFTNKKQPSEYIDMLRKEMLKAVTEYKLDSKQEGFGNFVQVEMFMQKKGYELPIIGHKQSKEYKIVKKHVQRSKKPIISPHRLEQQKTKPLEDLKRKFKIDMLKQSIQLRKQISKLQLSENKIREQITWETSKLQHEVVQKINEFITLSNVDQQQSYTNFKHTVNIETIKGIQNVIEQQTEMYMEKKNAAVEPVRLSQQNDQSVVSNHPQRNQIKDEQAFITGVDQQQKEEEQQDSNDRSKSLLDANISSMLVHMKKIKIFWAWKKTMKKQDNTKKQWCNFNQNVQNILNNDKIVDSIIATEIARNNYLKQNVTCSIIREENTRINQKIQELKISNLDRKVKDYREKLLANS